MTDNSALNFISKTFQANQWNVPVIFSGVNHTNIHKSHAKHAVVGVFESKDIHRSIFLAKKIEDNLSRIIFLGDGGPTDNIIKKVIKTSNYQKYGLDIIYLGNSNLNVLIN